LGRGFLVSPCGPSIFYVTTIVAWGVFEGYSFSCCSFSRSTPFGSLPFVLDVPPQFCRSRSKGVKSFSPSLLLDLFPLFLTVLFFSPVPWNFGMFQVPTAITSLYPFSFFFHLLSKPSLFLRSSSIYLTFPAVRNFPQVQSYWFPPGP